jgi:hypothetical protein
MSYFKNATVTAAELYAAAREVCSRLYVAHTGRMHDLWTVRPYPGTAAISVVDTGYMRHITLCMPAIPMDARLSRREADVLMAYVTHELGHALFTDFTTWKAAVSEGLHSLVNGLEDVRIELRLAELPDTLAGARDLLAQLTEHCVIKALATGWKPADPRSFAFTVYQYGATHKDVLAYAVPSMPDFGAACPPEMVAFLDEIMGRLKGCAHTGDVLDLARWIKAQMAAMGAKPEGKPEGDAEPQGDAGTAAADAEPQGDAGTAAAADAEPEGDAEGDAEPEGDAEGDAEPEGEKPGKPEGEKAEGEKGQKGGAGDWTDANFEDQRDVEPDLSDLGDRICENMGRDAKDVAAENADVLDYLNTPPSTPRAKTRLGYGSVELTSSVAAAIGTPARLRRDITAAVRAVDLVDVEHFQTRGRFDARAAVRVEAGAVNVFRRRSETPGQTAAVSFLIDLSSSMAGLEITAAAAMALHMGDALRAAAVPFEVLGFTNSASGATHGLIVAKAFGDVWADARKDVAAMTYAARGGTAMLPGIKAAVARLAARPGVTRRILLVLCDGGDRFSAGSNRAAVRAARAQGVEVIGIGLYCDASRCFGPDYVQVNSTDELSASGLGALVRILQDRRRMAA